MTHPKPEHIEKAIEQLEHQHTQLLRKLPHQKPETILHHTRTLTHIQQSLKTLHQLQDIHTGGHKPDWYPQ